MMQYFQFDIFLVDLNPAKGSEQEGKRPCVVLQTNGANNFGLTTIIAPLTSKKIDKIYSFEVKIDPSKHNGLTDTSKIKINQTRVIDKNRLINKIGSLEKKYHNEILEAVKIIFDFNKDFSN
jgi:mRNA interferase MazF